MFKNYLLIAYRFIIRYKGYSFINILGLATGLACTIIIYLWVLDELNFDTFHKNYDNIYRIVQNQQNGEFKVAATCAPMGPKFEEEFPEILESARYRPYTRTALFSHGDKNFYESGFGYADPEFFEIFSFNIIEGSLKGFADHTTSLIITSEMAEKYFGDENPIGKAITINKGTIYTVAAVIDNIPANSHIQFDAIAPFARLYETGWLLNWNNNYYYAYVLCDENIDYRSMEEKFHVSMEEEFDYEFDEAYYLQPLSEIHLKSDFNIDLYSHTETRYQYVYLFIVVGIIIILIVIINYMNLSTARATRRAREVGIRKVVGAKRMQLIGQFLGESLILTFISYFIAIIFTELLLPSINNLTGKVLDISYSNPEFVIGIFVILIFTGIVSGSYPAFYLSSFIPVNVLKGNVKSGSTLFRKVLVIFQFSLSVILIIGTFFIYKQLKFIQSKNLGIDKELLLYTSFKGKLYDNYFPFKAELKKLNNVLNVTYSNNIPTYTVNSTSGVNWEGNDSNEGMLMHRYVVDHDYVSTFNVDIIDGRDFDITLPTDSANYILNEATIRVMGMEDPVGKWFNLWGMKGTIIGVMKDFNFKSLHKPVEPLMLYITKDIYGYMFIKISSNDIQGTIREINDLWTQFNGEFPMDFKFLDDEYEKLYTAEQKLGKLFSVFAAIAVFLSCLGLFGLASYMTERRTKEIGIRKVFGASSTTVTRLLTWEFTKWVIISTVIAWPVAYIFLNRWLQNFAFRTDLDYYIFVLAGILVLLIAQLSVLFQTYRASRANPAKILKYE
ncbi:MAG: ABC transporter permease [Bacteroidales bacterium]|nr:ABC transporter permease [Bacteroidales bacterium]